MMILLNPIKKIYSEHCFFAYLAIEKYSQLWYTYYNCIYIYVYNLNLKGNKSMPTNPSPLFAMPLPVHIAFMAISLVVLLLSYKLKRKLYQLLMLAGILSTGLIYFVEPGVSFYILAFEEIAIFIAVVVLMAKDEAAKKKASDTQKEKSEN